MVVVLTGRGDLFAAAAAVVVVVAGLVGFEVGVGDTEGGVA